MLGKNTESFAILIHRHHSTKGVEVTSHKVIPTGKTFTLGAGRLFNQQDKDSMLDVFAGTRSDLQVVPDNVIAMDSSRLSMIWFKKPHKATVRFRNAEHTVMLPMLVFIKKEGEVLQVFATKGTSRPTANTKLYIAPIGNINRNGTMCGGNVSLGHFDGSAASIAACESFAIEATSTHLGDANPIKGVDTQEAYEAFIGDLAASSKAFPGKSLVPLNPRFGDEHLTLAAFLQGAES